MLERAARGMCDSLKDRALFPRCVYKWTGQSAMSAYITAPVTAGDGRQTKSPSECKCDSATAPLWI